MLSLLLMCTVSYCSLGAFAVIDDALCEKRLWDMKHKGVENFYMCEIRKDFTIDATFKGNKSRFLNHSCDPNCKLEKWLVKFSQLFSFFLYEEISLSCWILR